MKSFNKRIQTFYKIDLYPVITEEFCKNNNSLDTLKAILDSDIHIVQLREKHKSKKEVFHLAEEYRKLTEKYQALLIINDHLDIALAVDADGVHLGQEDLPVAAAKRTAPHLIIGTSTHNALEIRSAQEQKADYINIGPIFSTRTKELVIPPLGLAALKEYISLVRLPYTVMGGIKEENIRSLKVLGVSRFAMVTEITQSDMISEKIKKLRSLIKD